MQTVLFCNLPYAFSILEPIAKVLHERSYPFIWYVPNSISKQFPYKSSKWTSSLDELKLFNPEAIFVPGNDVPWYLSGVKVQIFHGLAGEKKGHFRIRDYFDLYLTQGPYFTKRFEQLAQKHNNFRVEQTGWSKLDKLFTPINRIDYLNSIFPDYSSQKIILYAPTFSPSLTSALALKESIQELSGENNTKVIVKFHDKMNKEIISDYQKIENVNLKISSEKDIIPLLQASDIMLSDTSSVVYEFLLLDKPVITLNSNSPNINWKNCSDANALVTALRGILAGNDEFSVQRQKTIAQYHPYHDGKSSERMVAAVKAYMQKNGVPKMRKISLMRKMKINKMYDYKIPLKDWF